MPKAPKGAFAFLGPRKRRADSMTRPILYGADYSVYVRIARMALEEKGIDYELVPLDIITTRASPTASRSLHM